MSHRVESEQRNYFTSVQSQLSATVVEPLSSMGQTYSENAKSGVSPSLNAVDTGMKAAMTLSGLGDAVFSSLAIPALGALGLKGMACLPISKQLDPVMGVDAHIMVPPGSPVPAPYIGILIYPKDFLAIAIASVIPPPPPMPEEGEGAPGEADTAKACEIIHTLATMAISMLGATVKIGIFIPRAVAGTTTRSIPHIFVRNNSMTQTLN